MKDEELQCDINREAAKVSALSSSKIDTYEYLTGEEILPPGQSRTIEWAKFIYFVKYKYLAGGKILLLDQSRTIEEAKFTYSVLGKAFEEHIEIIENQIKATKEQLLKSDAFIKKYDCYFEKDNPSFIKQEEIFNKLIDERHDAFNFLKRWDKVA